MRTKGKLLICGLIFVSGAVLNLFFSTAVHGLLTRKITRLSLLPIGDCLASLFSNLQGFVCVLAVMFFLTNMRPYESDLNTITPEIKTPKAVGQYQHGSARWMSDAEKEKAFDSFILDPNDSAMRELLKTGYDGLDFMKK